MAKVVIGTFDYEKYKETLTSHLIKQHEEVRLKLIAAL